MWRQLLVVIFRCVSQNLISSVPLARLNTGGKKELKQRAAVLGLLPSCWWWWYTIYVWTDRRELLKQAMEDPKTREIQNTELLWRRVYST